jgi:hypothetical protein
MARARGVDSDDYLAVAEISESDHLAAATNFVTRIIAMGDALPESTGPAKRLTLPNEPKMKELDDAVRKFVRVYKFPRDRPIPLQDIGEGEFGGARFRPMHYISLILRGQQLTATVSRIRRAIVDYNKKLEDEEQQQAVELDVSEPAVSMLQPVEDKHLYDGVLEYIRIYEFPPYTVLPTIDGPKWKPLQCIRQILIDDGFECRGYDVKGLVNQRIKCAIENYNSNNAASVLRNSRPFARAPLNKCTPVRVAGKAAVHSDALQAPASSYARRDASVSKISTVEPTLQQLYILSSHFSTNNASVSALDIRELIDNGMPFDSVAAAKQWCVEKLVKTGLIDTPAEASHWVTNPQKTKFFECLIGDTEHVADQHECASKRRLSHISSECIDFSERTISRPQTAFEVSSPTSQAFKSDLGVIKPGARLALRSSYTKFGCSLLFVDFDMALRGTSSATIGTDIQSSVDQSLAQKSPLGAPSITTLDQTANSPPQDTRRNQGVCSLLSKGMFRMSRICSETAQALGLSRDVVTQAAHDGMPFESIEASREWWQTSLEQPRRKKGLRECSNLHHGTPELDPCNASDIFRGEFPPRFNRIKGISLDGDAENDVDALIQMNNEPVSSVGCVSPLQSGENEKPQEFPDMGDDCMLIASSRNEDACDDDQRCESPGSSLQNNSKLPLDHTKLQLFQMVDAKDCCGCWYQACIVKMYNGSCVRVHFIGFGKESDENVALFRVRCFSSLTDIGPNGPESLEEIRRDYALTPLPAPITEDSSSYSVPGQLRVFMRCDVLDSDGIWYDAVVVKGGFDAATIKIHYNGWPKSVCKTIWRRDFSKRVRPHTGICRFRLLY